MLQELKKRGRTEVTSRMDLEPVRIVWTQGKVLNVEGLLPQKSRQITLNQSEPVIMQTEEGKMASVLLDFGCEIHGGLKILQWTEDTGVGAKIRIRFGESVTETMSEIGHSTNATNDHAMRDFVVDMGAFSSNCFGETGFRFVRVDLLEESKVQLKSILAVLVYKDVPYRGSFHCSDELLDQIWMMGAYTVHLNMQEYIWDGVKRDRLVWVGDLHPEILTIRSVFGADDSVERSLELAREDAPLPNWMNGMVTYSMWYAIIVYDWYYYTGNLEWVRSQAEYLKGMAKQLSDSIDETGKSAYPKERFLDWPSHDKADVVDAGMQAIHYMAAERLAELFEMIGEQEMALCCRKDMKRLKEYHVDAGDAKQAAALLALAGLADPEKTNEEVLKKDGAAGMSTYMGYYILAARALAGDYKGCLDCIREYWGGMLSLGATTFWEDFDIEWMKKAAPIDRFPKEGEVDVHGTYGRYCYKGFRHSLCHGWASGSTAWLTEYILGIHILEPGCKKIQLTPNLGDLDWAEGTYPTPLGELKVKVWKDETGKTVCDAKAPEGIILMVSC